MRLYYNGRTISDLKKFLEEKVKQEKIIGTPKPKSSSVGEAIEDTMESVKSLMEEQEEYEAWRDRV